MRSPIKNYLQFVSIYRRRSRHELNEESAPRGPREPGHLSRTLGRLGTPISQTTCLNIDPRGSAMSDRQLCQNLLLNLLIGATAGAVPMLITPCIFNCVPARPYVPVEC